MADPVKTNAEIVGAGRLMPDWVSDQKSQPVLTGEQKRAGVAMTWAYAEGQRDRDAEIERLRAVLRKIVDVTERWDAAGEYARDALEGTDG